MADAEDDPFELSQEETQVMLGRYAGASVLELSRSTGMPAEEVRAIVARLKDRGLLGDEETPAPVEVGATASDVDAAHDDLVALLDSATFDLVIPDGAAAEQAPKPASEAPRAPVARSKEEEAAAEPADAADAADEPALEPDEDDRAAEAAAKNEDTREYRKLYETELHALALDERVKLAGSATGATLFALCFDPVPSVIGAIFTNTAAALDHARLVAFHHRDPRGLEHVANRTSLVADPLVQRRLVRNPGTSEGILRRLLGNKRLSEVYRTSLDRDVPDRSRSIARTLLRTRWSIAQAEERVELVMMTEGRVLMALTGATFDSRMTAILCSKTYTSIVLVQNLARFPATPPVLLAFLLRQPMVKRQPHIRNMILQHQNTPSDAKRRG